MNKYFNLIYLIITFILVIIFGFFLTALFLPNPSKIKILSKNIVNTPTIKSYLENTYNSGYDANPSFSSSFSSSFSFSSYVLSLKFSIKSHALAIYSVNS